MIEVKVTPEMLKAANVVVVDFVEQFMREHCGDIPPVCCFPDLLTNIYRAMAQTAVEVVG